MAGISVRVTRARGRGSASRQARRRESFVLFCFFFRRPERKLTVPTRRFTFPAVKEASEPCARPCRSALAGDTPPPLARLASCHRARATYRPVEAPGRRDARQNCSRTFTSDEARGRAGLAGVVRCRPACQQPSGNPLVRVVRVSCHAVWGASSCATPRPQPLSSFSLYYFYSCTILIFSFEFSST
jgi:hypothetical protein